MANSKTFFTLRLVNLGVHKLPYGQKVYTQKLIMLKSPLMSKRKKERQKISTNLQNKDGENQP